MKDIPGYEGKYAITKDGEIWAYPSKRGGLGRPHDGLWLKQRVGTRGYKIVCLRNGGKRGQYHLVHRLVLQTFIGEPHGLMANHKNGVKTDNSLENLEWISQKANIHHARDVLGAYVGERNGRYIDGRRMKELIKERGE